MKKYLSEREFLKFKETFTSLLISEVKLIDKVIKYISKSKGKMIRPCLVINTAKTIGNITEKNYLVASLVEMIHLATLIHDDIVDESDTRRGWPTPARLWKNKIALLIGDYIFSKSLSTIVQLNDLESIKVLSNASDRLSKGEIFQIQESKNKIMSENSYFSMIKDKTASLFSAACELSARASSKEKTDFKNFKKFGENFGIAYQIKDDLNDVISNSKILGKPTNLDVKRNTLTLPYIHCLYQLNSYERSKILKKINKLSKKNKYKEIQNILNDSKSIDYCNDKINHYLRKAFDSINDYPNKKLLISVTRSVFNEN